MCGEMSVVILNKDKEHFLLLLSLFVILGGVNMDVLNSSRIDKLPNLLWLKGSALAEQSLLVMFPICPSFGGSRS